MVSRVAAGLAFSVASTSVRIAWSYGLGSIVAPLISGLCIYPDVSPEATLGTSLQLRIDDLEVVKIGLGCIQDDALPRRSGAHAVNAKPIIPLKARCLDLEQLPAQFRDNSDPLSVQSVNWTPARNCVVLRAPALQDDPNLP